MTLEIRERDYEKNCSGCDRELNPTSQVLKETVPLQVSASSVIRDSFGGKNDNRIPLMEVVLGLNGWSS